LADNLLALGRPHSARPNLQAKRVVVNWPQAIQGRAMKQTQPQALPRWRVLEESRSAITVLRTVEAVQLAEIVLNLDRLQEALSAELARCRAAAD